MGLAGVSRPEIKSGSQSPPPTGSQPSSHPPAVRQSSPPRPSGGKRRHWLIAAAIFLLAGAMIGIFFTGKYWPYRYREIQPLMEDVFGSQVSMKAYHRTYFPHPGFMATGISIRRKSAPDQPAIGSVENIFVQGRWIDLLMLRRRVQLVSITGVHLELPPPGSPAAQEDFPPGSGSDFTGPDTLIEHFVVHDSVLDVLRAGGGRTSFPIRELRVTGMQKGHAMEYAVDMNNAIPKGRIEAAGKFGPLNGKQLGATAASGQFTFTGVQLHDVGNIRGTLSASGQFGGRLDNLMADATSTTPDFAVDDARATRVDGQIRCTINALNGSVSYQSIDARTGATTVHISGATEGSPKATNLDIDLSRGRVQDVLQPFLHVAPPITGSVSLHAKVLLAPFTGGDSFLQRLHVDGAFDIPAERLTDPQTEKSLSAFSDRAQGKQQPADASADSASDDTTDAVSSVEGPATIRNAIVTTHGLTFNVAGAHATLDGTFNLHTSAANLTGNLAMDATISHATTGFKSFLLKPLSPFFKQKKAGAVIPIAITGTPGHYRLGQNIAHTK